MTTGMRYGLAALCLGAIAGVVLLVLSQDDSAAAAGLWSVTAAVFLLGTVGGLATVSVQLVRGNRQG